MSIDLDKLENIQVEGIRSKDAPDFCDAFVSYAETSGRPLTSAELDEVNLDNGFVYECVVNKIH